MLSLIHIEMCIRDSGRSLQLISQVKAAIIGNIEPVLATFWVWLFWHEHFSAYGWAGSALVISARCV